MVLCPVASLLNIAINRGIWRMVVKFMMKQCSRLKKKKIEIISLQNQISSTAISSELAETIEAQLLSREVWPEVERLQPKGLLNAAKYKWISICDAKQSGRCMIGPKFIQDNDPKHTAKVRTTFVSVKKPRHHGECLGLQRETASTEDLWHVLQDV